MAAVRKLIRERGWYAILEATDSESYDLPHDSHTDVRLAPRPRLFTVTIEIDHPDDGSGNKAWVNRNAGQFVTLTEQDNARPATTTDPPDASGVEFGSAGSPTMA